MYCSRPSRLWAKHKAEYIIDSFSSLTCFFTFCLFTPALGTWFQDAVRIAENVCRMLFKMPVVSPVSELPPFWYYTECSFGTFHNFHLKYLCGSYERSNFTHWIFIRLLLNGFCSRVDILCQQIWSARRFSFTKDRWIDRICIEPCIRFKFPLPTMIARRSGTIPAQKPSVHLTKRGSLYPSLIIGNGI